MEHWTIIEVLTLWRLPGGTYSGNTSCMLHMLRKDSSPINTYQHNNTSRLQQKGFSFPAVPGKLHGYMQYFSEFKIVFTWLWSMDVVTNGRSRPIIIYCLLCSCSLAFCRIIRGKNIGFIFRIRLKFKPREIHSRSLVLPCLVMMDKLLLHIYIYSIKMYRI